MSHQCRVGRFLPLAALAVLACGGNPDGGLDPAAGKAPSGPTVSATDPDTAVVDTTLDVAVSGSGFDAGSTAEWLLAGVPDPGVHTNSTRFVSKSQLVANITIASTAIPSTYDVAVTTSTGKKGIGTEVFVVTLRNNSATAEVTDAGMAVTSDGRGPYVDGQCGAIGTIFIANGSGDAVHRPYESNPATSAPCGGVPRVINIDLGSLGVQQVFGFNARNVSGLLPGDSRLQDFGFGLVSGSACARVNLRTEVGGLALLTATGLDAAGHRTWIIESQPPHYAGCYKTIKGKLAWDGVRRVVPFRILITEGSPK